MGQGALPEAVMKAFVVPFLAAAIFAGCASLPDRYEGTDAATLAGADVLDWTSRTTTMVVELNGQPRRLPYTLYPINVRPGVLKVGVQFRGGGTGAGCFEVHAAPGGHYQFSSTQVEDGFLVSLHEGQGASRKLIGKKFMPFRRWMDTPAYCPKEART
jgi:hypothetical protein